MRTRSPAALLAAAAVLAGTALAAPALAAGPDLVTVTGTVAQPDRPPFDAFRDAAFAHLEVEFGAAKAFDWDELTALPQAELTARYPNWPAPVTVRGPLLRDVLGAAGASGGQVTVQAADGYSADFTMADVQNKDLVLGIEMNGAPLALGGRGPAWLVFPQGAVADYPGTEDDGGLVWGVVRLHVQ